MAGRITFVEFFIPTFLCPYDIASLALDRDSAQWKLDDKYVQRRRNLFWELNFLEMIHVRPSHPVVVVVLLTSSQCLSLGRPPSLSAVYVDCEIPDDEELLTGDDGSNLGGCGLSFVLNHDHC